MSEAETEKAMEQNVAAEAAAEDTTDAAVTEAAAAEDTTDAAVTEEAAADEAKEPAKKSAKKSRWISREDREALRSPAWEKLEKMMEEKENVTVTITEAVKGGVTTTLEGIRAFIPASKLSLSYVEDLNDWVGKEIEVRVVTAEHEDRPHLVLSARDILLEKRAQARKNRAPVVKVGDVLEGKVETIQPYGVFVSLGGRTSGLVHISQMSSKRIGTPDELVAVGDTVKVKVIGIKDGKISLSMKATDAPDDASNAQRDDNIPYKLPKSESVTTSLGDLLKDIKL